MPALINVEKIKDSYGDIQIKIEETSDKGKKTIVINRLVVIAILKIAIKLKPFKKNLIWFLNKYKEKLSVDNSI